MSICNRCQPSHNIIPCCPTFLPHHCLSLSLSWFTCSYVCTLIGCRMVWNMSHTLHNHKYSRLNQCTKTIILCGSRWNIRIIITHDEVATFSQKSLFASVNSFICSVLALFWLEQIFFLFPHSVNKTHVQTKTHRS